MTKRFLYLAPSQNTRIDDTDCTFWDAWDSPATLLDDLRKRVFALASMRLGYGLSFPASAAVSRGLKKQSAKDCSLNNNFFNGKPEDLPHFHSMP